MAEPPSSSSASSSTGTAGGSPTPGGIPPARPPRLPTSPLAAASPAGSTLRLPPPSSSPAPTVLGSPPPVAVLEGYRLPQTAIPSSPSLDSPSVRYLRALLPDVSLERIRKEIHALSITTQSQLGVGLFNRLSVGLDTKSQTYDTIQRFLLRHRTQTASALDASLFGLDVSGDSTFPGYDELGSVPWFVDEHRREYFLVKADGKSAVMQVRVPRGQVKKFNDSALAQVRPRFPELPARGEVVHLSALPPVTCPIFYDLLTRDVTAIRNPQRLYKEIQNHVDMYNAIRVDLITHEYPLMRAVVTESEQRTNAVARISAIMSFDDHGNTMWTLVQTMRMQYDLNVAALIEAMLAEGVSLEDVLRVSTYLQLVWAPRVREIVK